MSVPDPQRGKAIVLLVALSLIWGTSFILMKRGLTVFSPGEVGSIRVIAAAIFLLPFAIVRLNNLTGIHILKLLASGLMGIFFPAFLFATAQTGLDSSVSGILNSLTPICTLLIGVLLFKQPFRSQSLLGIIIGLVGTVILIFANYGGKVGGLNLLALLVIVACILYAMNLNFVKYKISDLPALTITSVSILLISPAALSYLLTFTDFITKVTTHPQALQALGYIILLGAMSTSVATILFNHLVKISNPLFTSSVTYIIPIVAVGWGLLDGEQLLLGHFIGMVAIIGGVYL
ncbi:MAG TPA: DMT family transporter, partial [Chryseosolibacter sp.]